MLDLKVKKLGDLTRPIIAMAQDVHDAETAMDAHPTSYSRRSYVRALHAYMEGSVYLLKQTALSAAIRSRIPLTPGEYALMTEEMFDLTGAGEVRSQPKFLRLADNLRFTVGCVNRIFGANVTIDTSSRGWDDFRKSTKIRDRITHPKGLTEFEVTDAEISICRRMSDEWLNEMFASLVTAVSQRISQPVSADAGSPSDDSTSNDASENESGENSGSS